MNKLTARRGALLAVFAVFIGAWLPATAASSSWDVIGFEDHYIDYSAVACAADRCLVVGEAGTVIELTDSALRVHRIPAAITLMDVATDGCWFLAVGVLDPQSDNTSVILASRDGAHWIEVFRGRDQLHAVAWANGRWVAVGGHGRVVSGSTGSDWHSQRIGSSPMDTLLDLIWDGAQWVAVGRTDRDFELRGWVISSPDGLQWEHRATVPDGTPGLRAVASNGSMWVAAGGARTAFSQDLEHWHTQVKHNRDYRDLVWDGNRFVAMGSLHNIPSGGRGFVETSRVGQVFSEPEGMPTIPTFLRCLATSADGYLAAGDSGALLTVDSGLSAVLHHTPAPQMPVRRITGMLNHDATAYAIGDNTSNSPDSAQIATSSDGTTWSWQALPTPLALDLAVAGEVQVLVGHDGLFARQVEDDWTKVHRDSAVVAVAAGHPGFVAVVSNSGHVLFSPDGWVWVEITLAEIQGAWDVAYNGSSFLVDGYTHRATSADGTTWTVHAYSQDNYNRRMIAGGRGLFVSGTANGEIATSSDGVEWILRDSGRVQPVGGVDFTGEDFVVTGEDGEVLVSGDGLNWIEHNLMPPTHLSSATRVNGKLVVGGRNFMLIERPAGSFPLLPADAVLQLCD